MQQKALDLMAQAEAAGDVRGAIVALKEARECVALRARIGAELRATSAGHALSIQVEYVDPRDTLGAKLDALASRLCDGSGDRR